MNNNTTFNSKREAEGFHNITSWKSSHSIFLFFPSRVDMGKETKIKGLSFILILGKKLNLIA